MKIKTQMHRESMVNLSMYRYICYISVVILLLCGLTLALSSTSCQKSDFLGKTENNQENVVNVQ